MTDLEQFRDDPDLEQMKFIFHYMNGALSLRGSLLSDARHGVYANYLEEGANALVEHGTVPAIDQVFEAYASWRAADDLRKAQDKRLSVEISSRMAGFPQENPDPPRQGWQIVPRVQRLLALLGF